ncbi:MAG: hypothetical protein WC071_00075 [Victivallaceae bacterium]
MDRKIIKIQNLLLAWLGTQKSPVRHEKLRDICNACVFSVKRVNESYSLYLYFYPLVRSGLVECGLSSGKTVWQLSPAMVFYSDSDQERSWIGINLTENLKNQINVDEIIEDKIEPNFEQLSVIVRWKTSLDEQGEGLPIVHNPSTTKLLKSFPVCNPGIFSSEKEGCNLADYKQIYSPTGKDRWLSRGVATPQPGLYRLSEKIYSSRVYFNERKHYELGKDVNDSFWAKVMHCIDNNLPVAHYSRNNKTLKFDIEPPFIIGRVLFLNQMFSKFTINSKTYDGVEKTHMQELKRIFCNKIIEGAD